jgi:cell cycle checkpoint control protein RAD9A
MDEFDDVKVQDKLHIIISVKDFRAILQHAQMTSGALTTSYSNPGRPMKLSYSTDGVLCEFILMTVGEKDAMVQKHKTPRAKAAKTPGPQLDSASHRGSSIANDNRPDPSALASRPPQQKAPIRPRQSAFEIRPSPMPPPPTARSDSLFVDQAEDDEQWEPVNPDEEEEEENGRLEWNATDEPVLFLPDPCPDSSLTSRRTHRLCASEVIFPDRRNLKRVPPSALRRGLSQPNGCPRYVRPQAFSWHRQLTGAGPPLWSVFSLTRKM